MYKANTLHLFRTFVRMKMSSTRIVTPKSMYQIVLLQNDEGIMYLIRFFDWSPRTTIFYVLYNTSLLYSHKYKKRPEVNRSILRGRLFYLFRPSDVSHHFPGLPAGTQLFPVSSR